MIARRREMISEIESDGAWSLPGSFLGLSINAGLYFYFAQKRRREIRDVALIIKALRNNIDAHERLLAHLAAEGEYLQQYITVRAVSADIKKLEEQIEWMMY